MRQHLGRQIYILRQDKGEDTTYQNQDNIKNLLVKVKERKSDIHKHEHNTCKSEGAKKKQFKKLTEIEVQTQQEMREYK